MTITCLAQAIGSIKQHSSWLFHCTCRRPLYLTPFNECAIPKFVCTTLRPTLLPFAELYQLEGCCRFVSDFLLYEHLEDPLHPPKHLPSPMSVLAWQSADSFDAANVLASLLLGAGFNAYVVVGYVPLSISLNAQTKTECVILEAEKPAANGGPAAAAVQVNKAAPPSGNAQPTPADKAAARRASDASTAAAAGPAPAKHADGTQAAGSTRAPADDLGKRQKYVIRPRVNLVSKYLKAQEDAAKASQASETPDSVASRSVADTPDMTAEGSSGKLAAAEEGGGSSGAEAVAETGPSKRIHAWVLLLPGRRDVSK